MPRAAQGVEDFFNTPWWDRPTAANPNGGQGGGASVPPGGFDGPGWTGAGPDYASGTPGWNGLSLFGGWTAPTGSEPRDGGTVTLPPSTVNITANRLHVYRIEVRDEDGDLVAPVTDWTEGKLRLAMDEASTLEFSVPGDASVVTDLVRPNTVWVRDRWGFFVESFQIQRTAGRRVGDAIFRDVVCQSAIAQLGEEPVTEYNGAALSVGAHVAALLALQVRGSALTLGDIDEAITAESFAFRAQDTTILGALLQLQAVMPKAVAGHFYVDASRRLNWVVEMGNQPERSLPLGAGLQGVNHETDWSQLANRIYTYGEGNDPATRLNLTDAGEANEYVEDADSISTYGLAPHRKVDRRFRKPASLLRFANRLLEEFSTPQITVEVDALDLAKSDEYAATEDLYLGSPYRVVDTAQSVDTVVYVMAMEIDMTNPMPVRLELTNQAKRLGDLLGDLIDALTQPLDVLGDRYKNMGRNLSDGATPDTLRDGDTRWNSGKGEMYGDDAWNDMGGGATVWYTATSKGTLDDPSTVEATALGRVTGGEQIGQIYKVSGDATEWVAIDEVYEVEDFASLPSGSEIGRYARAYVVDPLAADEQHGQLYRRNRANTGWIAIDEQYDDGLLGIPTNLSNVGDFAMFRKSSGIYLKIPDGSTFFPIDRWS